MCRLDFIMSKRKIPIEDRNKIRTLYEELNSIPKLAKIYNVAWMTMWQYLKRHNIKTRKKGIKSPTYSRINENAFSVFCLWNNC